MIGSSRFVGEVPTPRGWAEGPRHAPDESASESISSVLILIRDWTISITLSALSKNASLNRAGER